MSDCIDKLQNEIDELKKDHKKQVVFIFGFGTQGKQKRQQEKLFQKIVLDRNRRFCFRAL